MPRGYWKFKRAIIAWHMTEWIMDFPPEGYCQYNSINSTTQWPVIRAVRSHGNLALRHPYKHMANECICAAHLKAPVLTRIRLKSLAFEGTFCVTLIDMQSRWNVFVYGSAKPLVLSLANWGLKKRKRMKEKDLQIGELVCTGQEVTAMHHPLGKCLVL